LEEVAAQEQTVMPISLSSIDQDSMIKKVGLGCGLALLVFGSTLAFAQDFSVDWHTLDGGGELLSETDDQQWQLSGTIGQPDATALIDLSGNGWTLTGGFWAVNIEQTDLLFRDSYEGEDVPPP
jgi:hypothetical protein